MVVELKPDTRLQGRYLVRLGDKHGSHLNHFYTKGFFEEKRYSTYTGTGMGIIRPGEEVKAFEYQVNVRDLKDTQVIELGFDSKYSHF